MTERNSLAGVLVPMILGGLAGFFASRTFTTQSNYIPKADKVQDGYVAPNSLEVTLQDLDNNGEKETIVKVDGKPYLLMYDEQKRPQLVSYEVMPSQIVPQNK
jgi:hypothetical protein